jgi:hypothetical protein
MSDEVNPLDDEILDAIVDPNGVEEIEVSHQVDLMIAHSATSANGPDSKPVGFETGVKSQEVTFDEHTDVIGHVGEFIRRFVFFRSEELYDLVAAWVVSTYMTDLFEYVGYLFAYSPEPQSGKSRLLEVLDLLVHNSSGILVSPTEAVLFRTADGQTQLLDEVDSWRNKDELRSVLNAGFRYGGTVVRMREQDSDYDVKRFSVYGPRALAGIGTKIIDATTRDRTFMIEMVRQKRDEKREQLRVRKLRPEANSLRVEIEKWSAANKERVKKTYDKSIFPYFNQFRDRTIDVTQPLATIVEVAYPDPHQLEVATTRLVRAIAITRNEEESAKEQHRILRQLEQVASSEDPLIGSATELSQRCANFEAPPSVEELSWTLRHYGFVPKSVRKGGVPKQRYTVSRAAISELLARYGGDGPLEAAEDDPLEQATLIQAADVDPGDVVSVVGPEGGDAE